MADRAAGWDALSSGRWEEALEHFEGLDDDPEALEGVGVAQWWLDDADATFAAREKAHRLYRAAGDPVGAARVASELAWDSLLFGGRTAVAHGWLGRAARLLEDQPTSPEHAWLAVREAEVALNTNEPETALAAARRAIAVGAEIGHEDVQVVARSLEGLALVQEGDVGGGMRRLDESAVAATAGDVGDLMWVGKVCCNLIAACERVGDVERATQWCAEVKAFAQRWELRTLFNTCRTQYAAVLLQQGTWNEAEKELTGALAAFARGRRAALMEGTARLGELRRRQGRVEEARALFAQAELSFVARQGQIELALDEGDAATALALAERLERAIDPYPRLSRVAVLALLAKAGLASRRPEVARGAVEELAELVETIGTGLARAAHAAAAGMLAAFEGELEDASRLLEDAADRYGESIAPYERALTQLALARVLARLGGTARARSEAGRAHTTFVDLDARRDAADAATLLQSLSARPARTGPLTTRELEVMRLVAAGRTNGEIAADLVVSEHTVHRHVANILRKLDEPTRAAAAARATRDGLV